MYADGTWREVALGVGLLLAFNGLLALAFVFGGAWAGAFLGVCGLILVAALACSEPWIRHDRLPAWLAGTLDVALKLGAILVAVTVVAVLVAA